MDTAKQKARIQKLTNTLKVPSLGTEAFSSGLLNSTQRLLLALAFLLLLGILPQPAHCQVQHLGLGRNLFLATAK